MFLLRLSQQSRSYQAPFSSSVWALLLLQE